MNNSTLKALLIEYEKKRINAENIAQKEKEKLYAEFPELANIDKKLSSLAFTSMRELAKNNDKKPVGIVLNAFSEPFILDKEVWDIVENMKSRLIKGNE